MLSFARHSHLNIWMELLASYFLPGYLSQSALAGLEYAIQVEAVTKIEELFP